MKNPRLYDPAFLAWLRKRPCIISGRTPVEACHIRMGNPALGKVAAGMQEKPSDFWCVPLHPDLHREQHSMNEEAFWKKYGINPFIAALRLYAEFGGTGGKPKGPRKINPRKPRDKRTKIASRKTVWPKRSFGQ